LALREVDRLAFSVLGHPLRHHHPQRDHMARMDRLFGVTMVERGVSQIVSVELAEAERLLEVG